ncbi:hypothetical protein DPMN_117934 [Dreissena polymorpha]|uniref:Uncharacterized protein n=1 Tax=Dreissena polymorpha TaxID=45954 RepID=A0A9D4GJ92_DREPO|nr:hypothetical protein DPMN_117934 [Dreissena polymorpha]
MFNMTGPYQKISTSLPADSPELQFGLFVYELGTMLAEKTLTVKGITIENEGKLSGIEHLVIGPKGVIILRYNGRNQSVHNVLV